MPQRQEVSRLQRELESFARRRNELTAARFQSPPAGVLSALFGDEALADPAEKQVLAERVVNALLDIIASIENEKDRRIAEAIFIAKPEFYGKNVTERQTYIEEHDYPIKELYKNRRPTIVADVVYALEQTFSGTRTVVRDVVLSSTARRAARQLYRYAQRALIPLEAFDLCTNCAVRLLVIFAEARLAQVNPEDLTHGWLAKYGNKGEDVRLVPASRTDESDQGLWALAYVYRYLRRLLQDRAGRVYVRESLPPESWESIQLRPAFAPDETDKMLSVLEEGQLDSPKVFVNDLCKDSQGGAIHEHWLKLLAAQSVAPSGDEFAALAREETVRDLLMLCIALQDVFPEETLVAPGEDFLSAVPSIIYHVAEELGVSVDGGDETAAVSALWDAILKYSPPRYVVEEGGQNREQVWNDRPSIPGVWAGLPVCRASVMRPESEDPEREPHEMRIVVMPGSGILEGFDCPEP